MPPREPSAVQGYEPEGIQLRNALADEYIDRSKGYHILQPPADIRPESDNYIVDQGLLGHGVERQLEELTRLANLYFTFKIKFFKFSRRPDRTLRDLLRRPFTHSDLEEEDIEEKFPGDRKARALIKALYKIIRHNQVRHIVRKRVIQAFFGIIGLVIPSYLWSHFGFDLMSDGVKIIFGAAGSVQLALSWLSWLLALAAICVVAFFVVELPFMEVLGITTSGFKDANRTTCSRLMTSMIGFNAEITKRFTLLIGIIKSSEDKFELVKQEDWVSRVKDLFKVAMWEGRRIECMEKYWQLQFERLRILELVSDTLGNISSVGLSIALILAAGIALFGGVAESGDWTSWLRAALVFVACAFAEWRLGWLSRRASQSFGMNDIIEQGFEAQWSAFGGLGYYEEIAQEFENGMGAKQMEKLRASPVQRR